MFTSKKELTEVMGVDPAIAAFFVDRKVPAGNLYWKGRLLYVARGTGFLFIPLYIDLQRRAGVDSTLLLSEPYVQLMEAILHQAALYEREEVSFASHLEAIREQLEGKVVHPDLYDLLGVYFQQQPLGELDYLGTGNAALNRGDALLYQLTTLHYPQAVIRNIIRYWYLLVPSFLLMDDIMDLQEDQEKNEENALSHYGYDAKGVQAAIALLDQNFTGLSAVNPVLGGFFRSMLEKKKQTPYFQYLLNS